HRAEKSIYVFYGLAACALSTILWPSRFPKTVAALKGSTLALALGSLAVGGWIATAGGKVRHSEFRGGGAPTSTHTGHAADVPESPQTSASNATESVARKDNSLR